MDCVAHGHPFLRQWLYRQWALTILQTLPVFHQLSLAPGERTRHYLDRINAVDRYIILVVSVEMRAMMRCASFPVHADDDTEETADLWYEGILASNREKTMRRVFRGVAGPP